jgi:hypothetical protein
MFGGVPETLAIPRPLQRCPIELRRQKDLRVKDVASADVVEQLTGTFIADTLARTIGRRCRGTTAGGA